VGDLARPRLAVAPAEAVPVEPERLRVALRKRALLVAEENGGQQVEEAVLAVAPHRPVEAGRRLERQVALPAGADEARERGLRRHRRTPAADLGAQPRRDERVEPIAEVTVERHLDVNLGRQPLQRCEIPVRRRLDRFHSSAREGRVEDHAHPAPDVR